MPLFACHRCPHLTTLFYPAVPNPTNLAPLSQILLASRRQGYADALAKTKGAGDDDRVVPLFAYHRCLTTRPCPALPHPAPRCVAQARLRGRAGQGGGDGPAAVPHPSAHENGVAAHPARHGARPAGHSTTGGGVGACDAMALALPFSLFRPHPWMPQNSGRSHSHSHTHSHSHSHSHSRPPHASLSLSSLLALSAGRGPRRLAVRGPRAHHRRQRPPAALRLLAGLLPGLPRPGQRRPQNQGEWAVCVARVTSHCWPCTAHFARTLVVSPSHLVEQ